MPGLGARAAAPGNNIWDLECDAPVAFWSPRNEILPTGLVTDARAPSLKHSGATVNEPGGPRSSIACVFEQVPSSLWAGWLGAPAVAAAHALGRAVPGAGGGRPSCFALTPAAAGGHRWGLGAARCPQDAVRSAERKARPRKSRLARAAASARFSTARPERNRAARSLCAGYPVQLSQHGTRGRGFPHGRLD